MRSMTGFGYASGEVQGHRCVVEMRSFNHRFFDLKLRLPTLWADPLLEQLEVEPPRRRQDDLAVHDRAIGQRLLERLDVPAARPVFSRTNT